MKQDVLQHQQQLKTHLARGTKALTAPFFGVLWICLATTTCLATEWQFGIDQNPQPIGQGAWHFTIDLGVRPVGHLQFVGSQYDFDWFTEGITTIVYDFNVNQGGSGYSDSREFLAIAPTLYDPIDGFIHGWDVADLKDGTFSGVVYATAPLTAVYFLIEADRFVPVTAGAHRLNSSH